METVIPFEGVRFRREEWINVPDIIVRTFDAVVTQVCFLFLPLFASFSFFFFYCVCPNGSSSSSSLSSLSLCVCG